MLRCCRRGAARARQVNVDRRPATDAAVDAQSAAGLRRYAVHHAEAETAALTNLLGREEGLDSFAEDLLRHALAAIGYRDQHIVAGS